MFNKAFWRSGWAATMLLAVIALVAGGQNRPEVKPPKPAVESSEPSRDSFGPNGASRLQRLSREQLEKAVEEESAEEETERRQPQREPRASGSTAVVPEHRFSRDALLRQPEAHATSGARDWQITLKNTFIEKYKNRATLTTNYRVISYKEHTPKEDGDVHVAGLTEDVGLACVAEIMNYRSFLGTITTARAKAASGELFPVTGAWRLWCEHPDAEKATAGPQIQDDVIPEFKTSNPNHVFEIHPISRFNGIPLEESFQFIPGYKPKDAKKAFQVYESLPCRIVPDPAHQTTTLFTHKVGFNYAEFVLQIEEDQQFVTVDGRIVRCSVLTLDGEVVTENRRMVFIKDTAPEKAVRTKGKGEKMHVLGIPRIDLALVSWRTRIADTKPEVLNWHLPYEMIVVGVYEE